MSEVKRRISLELDSELIVQLDQLAKKQASSRGGVIERACRQLLKQPTYELSEAEEEAYAEAYRRLSEEPAEWQVAVLAEVLAKEDW